MQIFQDFGLVYAAAAADLFGLFEWKLSMRTTKREYARGRIAYLVRIKAIKPGLACELCRKVGWNEAHHENYLEPEKVNWLCPDCHRKLHGKKSRIGLLLQKKKD